MAHITENFGAREDSGSVEVTVVVKVLKQERGEVIKHTYTTAAVDITVRMKTGWKIFEAFGVISLPEKQFDNYSELRKRLSRSLRSEVRRFVQTLEPNN